MWMLGDTFQPCPRPCAAFSPVPDVEPTQEALADFRGSRRLVGVEDWCWYLVAGVSYVVLGIWHKWLLNWFVGPAWLVGIIVIGPWLTDRIGVTGRGDHPPSVEATPEPPA